MANARTSLVPLMMGAGVLATVGLGWAWWRQPVTKPHPKTGKPITLPGPEGDAIRLFSGWKISPAGRSLSTGDMLLGGAFSPDGKTLAIANCGWNMNALHIVDVATEKEIAKLSVGKAWNGLAWGPDGKTIYLAGGISNTLNDLYRFRQDDKGEWEQVPGLKLTGNDPKQTAIAGLALTQDGKTLYVCNNSDDSLYVLDTKRGETLAKLSVGDHPVVCKIGMYGRRLYVANWGGAEVAVLDIQQPDKPALLTRIPVGSHPNDLALSNDDRLFVSCGNADAVSVIDLRSHSVMETIKTTLTPLSPSGSTPNALALTPDHKTLYIANADNNSACVVDVAKRGESRVRGFIPTGWYPTAALVSPDGKKLLLGSGKGKGTRPNPLRNPQINTNSSLSFPYIASQLGGMLSFLEPPTPEQLREYTRQVFANTPYRDSLLTRVSAPHRSPIPSQVGLPSPIQYVLYIIKENRTYDQVFGELPQGNGDPKLTLFGREVTPNHHALAEEFVLLDNLYCSGEVSADGHPWSTSAIATDFTQRSWVLSYSSKGSTRRTNSVSDPAAGYLWEACARKGLTYRSYGEYSNHKTLEGNISQAYIGKGEPGSAPPGRDTDRADIFIKEFREFERTGTLPRFMIMSLGEDHTSGTSAGAHTPKAMVASNDLALGKIVEAISQSRYWKEFAIFVIEDDAQNGPDHVDSHRTVGLAISPYIRRKTVDSTHYTTCSLLRTMELILGLSPMTQHDAAATPMFASFTPQPNFAPYQALPARIDLSARNPATAYGAKQSAQMDFTEYDRIDEDALNRILWHSIKGQNTPYPAPVRRHLEAVGSRQ